MLSRTESPAKSAQIESVLGKGFQVKGTIKSKGTLRIDGACEGSIEGEADVIVGESALVTSEIRAKNVTVAGTVTGNITVSGRLEILQTGKVRGDVKVGTLVIAEGALFQGNCIMESNSKEAEARPNQRTPGVQGPGKPELPK